MDLERSMLEHVGVYRYKAITPLTVVYSRESRRDTQGTVFCMWSRFGQSVAVMFLTCLGDDTMKNESVHCAESIKAWLQWPQLVIHGFYTVLSRVCSIEIIVAASSSSRLGELNQ